MKDFALLLFNVILSVLGQILLKQGMNQVGEISGSFQQMAPKLIQALMNPFVIGGIGVYGSTTLIWLVVLSRIKLSVAYPMISLGYRGLGAVVICIGGYLVSMGEVGD